MTISNKVQAAVDRMRKAGPECYWQLRDNDRITIVAGVYDDMLTLTNACLDSRTDLRALAERLEREAAKVRQFIQGKDGETVHGLLGQSLAKQDAAAEIRKIMGER